MTDTEETVQAGRQRIAYVQDTVDKSQSMMRKARLALAGLMAAVLLFVAVSAGITVFKLYVSAKENHSILVLVQSATDPKGKVYQVGQTNQIAAVNRLITCIDNHEDVLAGKATKLKDCP